MATKRQGVKCYDKAAEDEPLFVLRAQDDSSSEVILEWIKINFESVPEAKLREAFEVAVAMKKWPGRRGAT